MNALDKKIREKQPRVIVNELERVFELVINFYGNLTSNLLQKKRLKCSLKWNICWSFSLQIKRSVTTVSFFIGKINLS